MRRALIITAACAAVGASVAVGVSAWASVSSETATRDTGAIAGKSSLASDVLAARFSTAKYATNLDRAKADGYRIITRMIPRWAITS